MKGFSIIIPAHNEGAVIQRTLQSILANKLDRPLQIIVVANGCTDNTADEARKVDPSVQVIDTPVGNKIHALNLGDKAAQYFPRAFMDADIELSPNLLQQVASAFDDPACRIVAPGVKPLYTGRNPFLAGYYRLWASLPYVRRDTMARGFYAIDEQLRSRFNEFPSITADDKFIRNLAEPSERRVVDGCHTTVYMAATFRDLIAVKTRWTYGNLELSAARPDLERNDTDRHEGVMKFLLPRPWLWPHVPTFLFVWWYTRRAARKRLRERRSAWERAESSRAANSRT
jgi:glycosyltransferase involved in cell wall biosynthesis